MPRLRRIVHPTDYSPASAPAFRQALTQAKDDGATLHCYHVLPTLPMVADAYIAASAYDEMLRAHRTQAEKSMEKLVKRARAAGVKAVGTVDNDGSVADRIVRYARRVGADVIVMGTHGHGIIAKALLGSIAERVIARSTCPVTTVRGR
jgi:nucleotide-binding universal stress UspA family protein